MLNKLLLKKNKKKIQNSLKNDNEEVKRLESVRGAL